MWICWARARHAHGCAASMLRTLRTALLLSCRSSHFRCALFRLVSLLHPPHTGPQSACMLHQLLACWHHYTCVLYTPCVLYPCIKPMHQRSRVWHRLITHIFPPPLTTPCRCAAVPYIFQNTPLLSSADKLAQVLANSPILANNRQTYPV